MKPAPFCLHIAKTLEEAVKLLDDVCGDGGIVIAGGQSLVPMMALRAAYPPHLVDINQISELATFEVTDSSLNIGATVRHANFHGKIEPGVLGELLSYVSHHIAHYPIRMRGTFCGSLAHADPSSEWCLVAATLSGEIQLSSVNGQRHVLAEEFLDGAMTTTREANEILTGVRLPRLSERATFGFYEFNRRAGDFAIGMSLVTWDLDDGKIANARVGLGGIEEKSRRISVVEELIEGKAPDSKLFDDAASLATTVVDPMEDAATPALYRKDLTSVVLRRAFQAAVARSNMGMVS